MKHVRSLVVLTLFLLFTLPLMPVQLLLARTGSRFAKTFPNWYHRWVCRIIGIHIDLQGQLASQGGVLLIANHVSWIDIPVLSAIAPVSFIAKREVAGWPFVSWLAKLQRTVFVDRERRTETSMKADEILGRLRAGDNIVLFAEGTSSDGRTVLPFKTSLFSVVKPSGEHVPEHGITVQTLAIAYRRIWGLPVASRHRHLIGWYGDMEMGSHGWRLLGLGPLDVSVRLGPPVPLESFGDRKELARYAEDKIRSDVIGMIRGQTGSAAAA